MEKMKLKGKTNLREKKGGESVVFAKCNSSAPPSLQKKERRYAKVSI
jgi:hypothetical protein